MQCNTLFGHIGEKSYMNKKKVVLGMSGGVDSSVAAYLLKEQGYEVIGVTMNVWPDYVKPMEDNGRSCCSLSSVYDARSVADMLDIPHYVLNFKDIFNEKVIDYFVNEYLCGRTPNPCIACNRYIKFEELLRRAISLDAFYVATGHYCKISYNEDTKRHTLSKSEDLSKDQTYVLYNMSQYQLEHTLMPLGDYKKEDIRKLAEKLNFSVAKKPDSQEICFIPDNDYAGFIERYAPNTVKKGNFINTDGKIIGRHDGIVHYTIGQRKGLGGTFGKPMFVTNIDVKNNTVVLGEADDVFGDLNWVSISDILEPIKAEVKIRYSAKPSPAEIIPMENGRIKVEFETPQRAITPGQSAVFYQGETVLGGGKIIE